MSAVNVESSVVEAALKVLLQEWEVSSSSAAPTVVGDGVGRACCSGGGDAAAGRSGERETVLAEVAAGLARLGLAEGVVSDLVAVLGCAAAHAESEGLSVGSRSSVAGLTGSGSGEAVPSLPGTAQIGHRALVEAAAAVRGVQGFADAVAVSAGRTLTHRAGAELLGRRGVADPDELSGSGRARWRAKSKSVTAQELAVATGWSVAQCHARVGFAAAPAVATATVGQALQAGVVQWAGVARWWSQCRRMDVVDAATVAEAVFGPLLAQPTPEDADRAGETDGDTGSVTDPRRESWAEFCRRLDREVVRVQGVDAAAARARRRAALESRDVFGDLCDDGLGTVCIQGPTAAVAGAVDRIESIARKARAGGDRRPLRHIRADTALALLVHGTLRFDHPAGQEPLLATPDDVERIVRGLPATTVELLLPLTALNPAPAQPSGSGSRAAASGRGRGGGGDRAGASPVAPCPVGEVTGHGFVTPEHARELALVPGSVWHRVLFDPLDGQAVERSVSSYRPDQAMVDQIRAIDRSCRSPGCQVPAARCDLDHEHPYGQGGPTMQANLNPKHRAHHALKTEGWWTSVMDATRSVTWQTLFGRVYRTRPTDHRTLHDTPSRPAPTGPAPAADGDGHAAVDVAEDVAEDVADGDLRDRLVYAALSSREGMDHWLEGLDDHDEHPDTWTPGIDRPLRIFHRQGLRRRHGPPATNPTVDQLLDRSPTPPVTRPRRWRPDPATPPRF